MFIRNKKRKYKNILKKKRYKKKQIKKEQRKKNIYTIVWKNNTSMRTYTSKKNLYNTIQYLEFNYTNYYKTLYRLKRYYIEATCFTRSGFANKNR